MTTSIAWLGFVTIKPAKIEIPFPNRSGVIGVLGPMSITLAFDAAFRYSMIPLEDYTEAEIMTWLAVFNN